MRRRIGLLVSLVALLALGGGLLAATPAWATPPQHFHQIPINDSFRDDELSAACGFDVVLVFAGNIDVTLFYDQSGALVRSTFTFPAATQSFTAPSTGKSIVSRSPFPVITDYTGGGAVGTLAVVRATGLVFMFEPGVMLTGRTVLEAVVTGHTDEGIPIFDETGVISQSGNFFSGDLVPLICAALGP